MKMESKTKQPIFPWYKKRLRAKYLKAPDNKLSSSRCWCFTNTSLKDFSVCSLVTPGVDRQVSPLIFPGTQQHNSSQKPRKSISKETACFSKQMTQKQIRSAYVASVEEKLKQHPLAMYPHYKDHLTPELFNRVVAVLDPDMCVSNASALPAPSEDLAEEEEDEENCRHPSKEEVVRSKQETDKPKMMNASGGAPSSRLFATNCAHSSTQQLLRLCIKSQPGRPFIFPKQELNSVQITNMSEI